MNHSKNNLGILEAIKKGYKIVGNEVISHTGKSLSLKYSNKGYPTFAVSLNGFPRNKRIVHVLIHRFVAYLKYGNELFNPGIEARHLNGITTDFSIDNIAIGTHQQNIMDKSPTVMRKQITDMSAKIRKFTDEEMLLIKKDRENGMIYSKIMSKWNISSKGTLHYILNKQYITSK